MEIKGKTQAPAAGPWDVLVSAWMTEQRLLESRGSPRLAHTVQESTQDGPHTTEIGTTQRLDFTEQISLPKVLSRLFFVG